MVDVVGDADIVLTMDNVHVCWSLNYSQHLSFFRIFKGMSLVLS